MLFRQEAIDNQKLRWRGRALLLPGIPPWLIIVGCLIFFLLFLSFVIGGTYTRRVNVSGEITSLPRAINIYSSAQGFVVKQFVHKGDRVKKGDPLYQLDISRSTLQGVVSDNQRKDIESQLNNIENIISRLEIGKRATLSSLAAQKKQYIDAYQRSSAILKKAEEGIAIMKNNMENYQRYQARGLINKDQLTNQVALYYQQQNNLLGLSSQNEQNALQISTLESQLQIQSAEFDNRIYQMELQRHELLKEKLTTEAGGDLIIRALSDGQVDSLSVTVGQMVNVGDSLAQLLPQHIAYYSLVFWVPNDALPYLAEGDRVNVRYDAFPAEKFGQFSATITQVSKSPASPQEMMTYQGAPKTTALNAIPYYKVLARPQKQTIPYEGKARALENGMKAQGTLFLEKRTIYQWMLSPFYDMQHSAVGPVND